MPGEATIEGFASSVSLFVAWYAARGEGSCRRVSHVYVCLLLSDTLCAVARVLLSECRVCATAERRPDQQASCGVSLSEARNGRAGTPTARRAHDSQQFLK